jgi:signal peptidase II
VNYLKYYILTLGVIILDQIVKLIVHFNMSIGEEIKVFGDWFKIHYTENAGMAFGLELDFIYGKLILTVFRLAAMAGIGYYLYHLARKNAHPGLLWSVALILAGAIGNVIDSTFYGVLLHNAPYDAPTPWFHGKVVDMFYLDIWQGRVAGWVPVWGGAYVALWPIFNIADASIFIGVSIILVMQRKFFRETDSTSGEILENDSLPVSD